jgi:hypothetical protein
VIAHEFTGFTGGLRERFEHASLRDGRKDGLGQYDCIF